MALAGIIAGISMAMYAMIASATFLNQGFFTPLYAIASPITGQATTMRAMQGGFYFDLGPALLGLMIHMAFSALFGVIFGQIIHAFRLSGVEGLITGLVFGLVIMLFMAWVVLPIVGASSMLEMLGWPSFIIMHLIFGMVLGLWPLVRPQDVNTTYDRPLAH